MNRCGFDKNDLSSYIVLLLIAFRRDIADMALVAIPDPEAGAYYYEVRKGSAP